MAWRTAVVERATLGVVATFDMGGRDAHLRASDHGSECLAAIGAHHEEVGLELPKDRGQAQDALSDHLCRRDE